MTNLASKGFTAGVSNSNQGRARCSPLNAGKTITVSGGLADLVVRPGERCSRRGGGTPKSVRQSWYPRRAAQDATGGRSLRPLLYSLYTCNIPCPVTLISEQKKKKEKPSDGEKKGRNLRENIQQWRDSTMTNNNHSSSS